MIQPRFRGLIRTVLKVVADVVRLTSLAACSHAHLAAENLFLRKHLALYLERQVRPRRADDATRITLVAFGARRRARRRTISCCLSRRFSAITARTPLGPHSFAVMTARCDEDASVARGKRQYLRILETSEASDGRGPD